MVFAVFLVVYAGMFLGGLPRLQIDRTGVALLGALVLLATGSISLDRAAEHVDVPTLALLFGMMVLSAQLRLGGVYRALTRKAGEVPVGPSGLLALVVALVGTLAAVFTNDVVALAVAPVVVALSRERGLSPLPFLLAVACSANVGSAATLIGNPQNILVGQSLGLSFGGYLARAFLPAAGGLVVVWAVVTGLYRNAWREGIGRPEGPVPQTADPADVALGAPPPLDRWQATKGLFLAALAFLAFLLTPWPRELVALAAAAVVLTSRRFHSRQTLGLVDWDLLVLFVGLFVVNGALADTGLVEGAIARLDGAGADLSRPGWLFTASVGLSNLVSNVPAVMLLLPVTSGDRAGALLALSSTLAGNLLIVGSIANVIVVEQARILGVEVDWRTHARVGVPVTALTLTLAWVAIVLA